MTTGTSAQVCLHALSGACAQACQREAYFAVLSIHVEEDSQVLGKSREDIGDLRAAPASRTPQAAPTSSAVQASTQRMVHLGVVARLFFISVLFKIVRIGEDVGLLYVICYLS